MDLIRGHLCEKRNKETFNFKYDNEKDIYHPRH